ncbi:MAG: Fic family protein [Bacteroidetes bacterium]|nr:Fic family protein [Bacteroidota bacterium]
MALADTLNSIDDLKQQADALRPIAPDRLNKLNQKLRLDWNYNSNAIEGNTLTLSETKMLLVHGLHMGNKLGRHYEEIELHNEVLLTLEDLVRRDEPITEVLIRNLHHQLMGNTYFVSAVDTLGNTVNVKGRPGEYKDRANGVNRIINGREVFVPFRSPDEVRIEMPELVQWFREEELKKELHPITLAAIFHYRFVTLHPFDDGNGRMSRILMNMILMRAGFAPAIIRVDERPQYISALALAQDGGTIEPFIELVAQDAKRSMELLIKAASGESIEDPDDLDKEIELLKRKLQKPENAPIYYSNNEYKALWQKGIKEFLLRADEKLQKFDGLFRRKTAKFLLNSDNTIREFIDSIIHNLAFEGTYAIDYYFSEYQDQVNGFDLRTTIFIEIKDLKYSLKYSVDTTTFFSKDFKYDALLTDQDIENLSQNVANDVLKAIKTHTGQNS